MPARNTLHVSVTPELAAFVGEQIASGSYQTASEIVRAGLRLLVLSGWQESEAYGRVSGMNTTSNPYRGFRFPPEIINQAVWLYHCFSLSLREVD
jgi:putative addiction module CopG family antidote